jgi:hypothetical protein
MKPETRDLLYASGQLLRIGIDRALGQHRAEEDTAAKGRPVDENTWRYYSDLGVKAYHDIAKLAALEMRDEAAEERRALREAEPVSPNDALRILKAELARVTGEAAQPAGEAAKAETHAPQGQPVKPAINIAELREAWGSSHQWLTDARQGQMNPITHKVRKVLPSLGINEGEPMETVMRFREAAAKVLGIAVPA